MPFVKKWGEPPQSKHLIKNTVHVIRGVNLKAYWNGREVWEEPAQPQERIATASIKCDRSNQDLCEIFLLMLLGAIFVDQNNLKALCLLYLIKSLI